MSATDPGTEETQASRDARLATVEEHIKQENQHDLDGIMATFGEDAWYDDESRGEHYEGRDGVHGYYEELLEGFPDLHIDVQQRYVTDDHVILETLITGTHTGDLRGFPGTGREVEISACAVYAFDDENTLAGERLYYDRASLFRQLGIFREPTGGLGQVLTVLSHPVTVGRALLRSIRGQ